MQTTNQPVTVSSRVLTTVGGFMTQVYLWMSGGLLVTTIIALLMKNVYEASEVFFLQAEWLFPVLFIVEFLIVIGLAGFTDRLNAFVAGLLFLVYSVINGVFFGLIIPYYTDSSIALAFGATAGAFLIMTLYGAVTKADLTKFGNIAIMGLFGLILGTVINLLVQSDGLSWLLTYLGVVIFIVLTAYDTQKLKSYALAAEQTGNVTQYAVRGALTLYLDFINLFIRLLRIFGKRR